MTLEKLKNILITISAVIGALTVIGGAGWKIFDIDQRSFSTLTDKVETETHTRLVRPEILVRQQMKDSIQHYNDSIAEVKFRKEQDSVDNVRDSLTRLLVRMVYDNQKKIETELSHAMEHVH